MLDNSPATADIQARLAADIGALIDGLVGVDLRVGITTTDSGNSRCPDTTPTCVRDTVPDTAALDPDCDVVLVDLIAATRSAVSPCIVADGQQSPPPGEVVCYGLRFDPDGTTTSSPLDDMSPRCVDHGFNTEFVIVRTAPLPPGSTLTLRCAAIHQQTRGLPAPVTALESCSAARTRRTHPAADRPGPHVRTAQPASTTRLRGGS